MRRLLPILVFSLLPAAALAWTVAVPIRSELARMTDVFLATVSEVKVVETPCPAVTMPDILTTQSKRDQLDVTFTIDTIYKGVLKGTFSYTQSGLCGQDNVLRQDFKIGQEWYVLKSKTDTNFIPVKKAMQPMIKERLIVEAKGQKAAVDKARRELAASKHDVRKKAWLHLATLYEENEDRNALVKVYEDMLGEFYANSKGPRPMPPGEASCDPKFPPLPDAPEFVGAEVELRMDFMRSHGDVLQKYGDALAEQENFHQALRPLCLAAFHAEDAEVRSAARGQLQAVVTQAK